jgi:hypothetical protein
MGDDQEAPWLGLAEEKEAVLVLRMVWVVDGAR